MRVLAKEAAWLRHASAAELHAVTDDRAELAPAEAIPAAAELDCWRRRWEERQVGRDASAAKVCAVTEQRVTGVPCVGKLSAIKSEDVLALSADDAACAERCASTLALACFRGRRLTQYPVAKTIRLPSSAAAFSASPL